MPPSPAAPRLLYCWPEMFNEQPGLGHMKEIARTLLIEASSSGRVAILPPLKSNPRHNPHAKGNLNWNDYFDWSALPVENPGWTNRSALGAFLRQHPHLLLSAGEPIPPNSTGAGSLLVRFFADPNIFDHQIESAEIPVPPALQEPAFSNHYPDAVIKTAAQVLSETGPLRGVLHIRRGDLAGPDTAPAAVLAYLRGKGARADTRIFVLTNERNPDYLATIRREFPLIVFEHEVSCLQKLLRTSGDNYLIFRIGKYIQANHDTLGLGTLRFMRNAEPPANGWLRRSIHRIRQTARSTQTVTLDWLEQQQPLRPVS